MSLASLWGLEPAIWLIRSRGFVICESRTMGGPEGHFHLKGRHVTPQEVKQFAEKLEERQKMGLNSPPPARPPADPVSIFQPPKTQEQPTMADHMRGTSPYKVRADMEQLREEWGSDRAAAEAAGLSKTTFVTTRNGSVPVGRTAILALYGPTGTTLRPEIRNTGRPAAPTPPPSAPEAPASAPSGPETPAEEPPAISAPPEAPKEITTMPNDPSALAPVSPPEEITTPAAEDKHEGSVCEIAQVAPPAWLTPALTALDQQAARLAEEITARRTQLVRLEQAMQLLKELA